MSDFEGPKKKISPITVLKASKNFSQSPSKMLDEALIIINEQLERFRLKSAYHQLDEKETRMLLGYVKGLVDISKEERERDKADPDNKELQNLSTEELVARAQAQLNKSKETK